MSNQFVSQFYTVLHTSPRHLHRFYSEASTLTLADARPDGQHIVKTVTGQKVRGSARGRRRRAGSQGGRLLARAAARGHPAASSRSPQASRPSPSGSWGAWLPFPCARPPTPTGTPAACRPHPPVYPPPLQSIHEAVMNQGLEDTVTEVYSVDSQYSLNGGVVVQVTGTQSNKVRVTTDIQDTSLCGPLLIFRLPPQCGMMKCHAQAAGCQAA